MGSSSRNRELVFDEVRRLWVKATPEEQVRQLWLRRMVGALGFPRELIVVEKAIQELPHLQSKDVPERRLDILCYGKDKDLFPLLLIECKKESLSEGAINQVMGYNHFVRAHFAAVVSRDEARLGHFDGVQSHSCSFLPSYQELMQWVKR